MSQNGIHKMKIRVIIPSYNREQPLRELLAQIKEMTPEYYEIYPQVWIDGSDYGHITGAEVRKVRHHGKIEHWRLCDTILKNQAGSDFKYFFWLPDDGVLVPDFFNKAISQWKAIKDREKGCLNLLCDEKRRGKANWTGKIPTLERHGKYRIYLSHWVDMCFMFQLPFLEGLNYSISRIPVGRWTGNPKLSSGVGQQISLRLMKIPLKMFQVHNSLCKTGHLPSVMHPWRKPVWNRKMKKK